MHASPGAGDHGDSAFATITWVDWNAWSGLAVNSLGSIALAKTDQSCIAAKGDHFRGKM
jgi:hypothetical protein